MRIWTCIASLLCVSLVACSSSTTQYYGDAIQKQEHCCGQLADEGTRQACLSEIVRTEDARVQTLPENNDTYYCINTHFTCDPQSGRATRNSAQQQLDCLVELEQE